MPLSDPFGWENTAASIQALVIGESTASQLPGRHNGGPADAYRHVLLAAELTRQLGPSAAYAILLNHEFELGGGIDQGLDMWNNEIGMRIGEYARANDLGWDDIVRLSRIIMVASFEDLGGDFTNVSDWHIYSAEAGLALGAVRYHEYNGLFFPLGTYFGIGENFSSHFDHTYSFYSNFDPIILENGDLNLFSVAVAPIQKWAKNPIVVDENGNKNELTIEQSAFPNLSWFEGGDDIFVYEPGNAASPVPLTLIQFVIEDYCFLAGTRILMWDGREKPIEQIQEGDLVTSYDEGGQLSPGTVTNLKRSRSDHILDICGLKVTPGHITLCGDGIHAGKHVPIIDILRSDGSLVTKDGERIRASIGSEVGSVYDSLIWAVTTRYNEKNDTYIINDLGQIRLGTKLIEQSGKEIRIIDLILSNHGKVTKEGLIQYGPNNEPEPFNWVFTDILPNPEDFVLQKSGLRLHDLGVPDEARGASVESDIENKQIGLIVGDEINITYSNYDSVIEVVGSRCADDGLMDKERGMKWETYNFSVSPHRTYIANGFRVHNESILRFLDWSGSPAFDFGYTAGGNPYFRQFVGENRDVIRYVEGRDIDDPKDGITDKVRETLTKYHSDDKAVVSREWDEFDSEGNPIGDGDLEIQLLGRVILGEQIGATLGSTFGRLIAGENFGLQVGISSILGAVGANLGEAVDNLFAQPPDVFKSTLSTSDYIGEAFDDIGLDVLANGVGSITSYLIGELFAELGLDGVPGDVLQTAVGHTVSSIASNIITEGAEHAFDGLTDPPPSSGPV